MLSPVSEGVCEELLGGLVSEEERGVGGECSDEGGGEAAVEGGRALAGQDAAAHPHHAASLTPHLQTFRIWTRRRSRSKSTLKHLLAAAISSMHHIHVKCRCLYLA